MFRDAGCGKNLEDKAAVQPCETSTSQVRLSTPNRAGSSDHVEFGINFVSFTVMYYKVLLLLIQINPRTISCRRDSRCYKFSKRQFHTGVILIRSLVTRPPYTLLPFSAGTTCCSSVARRYGHSAKSRACLRYRCFEGRYFRHQSRGTCVDMCESMRFRSRVS